MSTAEKNLSVVQGTQSLQGALSNFSREQIDVIKRTVAKGVTDAELSMFLTICGRYQLDPFLKEIWCYKRQKKDQNTGRYMDDPNAPAVIQTSRDGYLAVAQRHADYEGLKSFVVKEGDTFEIDAESDKVIHKFGAKRGNILGAWASCYRSGRRPVTVWAEFEEYNASSPIWKNYPSAMIQKVAEALALKRQFGISGLVTQEEMATDMDIPYGVQDDQPVLPERPVPVDKDEWLKALNGLNDFGMAVGLTGEEVKAKGAQLLHKTNIKAWSLTDIATVHAHIESEVLRYQQTSQGASVDATRTTIDLDDGGLPDDEDLPF